MKGTFASIQADLATQLAELEKARAETVLTLKRLHVECRMLRAALKALGADIGEDPGVNDQKKAPKQVDVATALNELLMENPSGIDRVDLEPLLAEQLATKHHRTAVGLALRIKEVLASGQFVEEERVIRSALGVTAAG